MARDAEHISRLIHAELDTRDWQAQYDVEVQVSQSQTGFAASILAKTPLSSDLERQIGFFSSTMIATGEWTMTVRRRLRNMISELEKVIERSGY